MTETITPRNRMTDLLLFALLGGVFAYYSLLGATFNGILGFPELMQTSLVLFAVLVIVWLIQRTRKNWRWHITPLDTVFLLWGLVIATSIYFNLSSWRRSAEAVWYLLLYLSVFYMLHDMLSNRALTRGMVINGLIFAGVMVMLFAYVQIFIGLQRDVPLSGLRPVSLIGNPNAFANIMLVLLPLSTIQAMRSRQRVGQVVFGAIAVSAVLLIALGQSRGAIAALIPMIGVFVLLLLAHYDLLSPVKFWRWLQQQSSVLRYGLLLISVLSVLLIVVALVMTLQSLDAAGRSLELRTYLWDAGWQTFLNAPLTGEGLFTFGQHLPTYDSIPDGQPHSHPHNIILLIAAEMGVGGILVLLVTGLVVLTEWVNRWRNSTGQTRLLLIALTSAFVGYVIHHLFDVPAMMPLIALIGMILLVLLLQPQDPQPMRAWRKIGHPIGLISIWVVLLAIGFWNVNLYSQYLSILRQVDDSADYAALANQLQPIVDAAPQQRAYILQQAYLYGLAAHYNDDMDALDKAIRGYRRYTRLEPTHAQGWSNLAALYYQRGERVTARSTIESAIVYAPEWREFIRQRNIYAGAKRDGRTKVPSETPSYRAGANWARFQYLRDVLETEYLPQVGYGWQG